MTEPTTQMANHKDEPQREILPIPDRPHVGLTTYDAKDPDTSFPPIEPCGHPRARRTCL